MMTKKQKNDVKPISQETKSKKTEDEKQKNRNHEQPHQFKDGNNKKRHADSDKRKEIISVKESSSEIEHTLDIGTDSKSNSEQKQEHIREPIKQKNPSNSSSDKLKVSTGSMLEYRIQRLLFHMGYFSKVGIELKTSQETDSETITDLDVYGVYIHKDFRYKTVWADCKSGRAKPLERISWMKGIKEYHDIEDILFVKGGVKSSIKHFARKSDIQVLDLILIERLEKDYSIEKDDWSGSWNPNLLLNKLNDFSKLSVPDNENYKKIAKFISSDYWVTEKYTRLKKCITAFREISTIPVESLTTKDQNTIKWGVYELTTLFVLSLLNIIRELYYFSEHERKIALHDGLVSGEISIKKRTELVSAAYRLAFELMRAQQPDFKPPSNFGKSINISPPSYFDALDSLISRIIHNPLDYYDIIRILDYSLLEFELQGKSWDLDILNKVFDKDVERNLVAVKSVLHFICQVTGISKKYYSIIK